MKGSLTKQRTNELDAWKRLFGGVAEFLHATAHWPLKTHEGLETKEPASHQTHWKPTPNHTTNHVQIPSPREAGGGRRMQPTVGHVST